MTQEPQRVVQMKLLIERVKLYVVFIHKIVGVCYNRYFIHNLGIISSGLLSVALSLILKSRPIQFLQKNQELSQ